MAENFLPDAEAEVFVFPASFAQQRLWFIDQFVPGNTFYNVSTMLLLEGTLNLSALEQTFSEIVRRHEILRTTFNLVEGQLVQVIAVESSANPLTKVDLRELPIDEKATTAKQLITAEIEYAFNLSTGPLFRVLLLHLNETEQILLLNLHHIVCDDWSIGVLSRELGTIYTAFCQQQPVTLPELPLQYADFAEWQCEWLQEVGENGYSPLQTQLAYWRQQLQGISPLNLPTARSQPATASYRGASQFLEIPQPLSEALALVSQQEGVTLFMTLLAAFQTLLYRYTQQEDIAIGSPIANRNRSEIEGLIGFFVNTLVLRTDLSGNPTFRELLQRVREVTLAAYAHQDLPFEKLVEELHPTRNLGHHPLFQVVFGFQNSPMETLDLPGLVVSFLNTEIKTTRFDLEFLLWEATDSFRNLWGGDRWQYSEGIRGIIVYNTDLFAADTITRMLGHFTTLLEGIVANPDQRLYKLPLLTAAERHQLLVEFNNSQSTIPQVEQCIHQLFAAQVQQRPEATAIGFEKAETRSLFSLTYQELNSRSNQLAHHLQKLGVGADVLVGICIEPSVEMIVGLLGILKAGGAYLPLDPSYPQERLNFMLEDAQVSVLITQHQFNDFHLLKKEGSEMPPFLRGVRRDRIKFPLVIYLDTDWEEKISHESEENTICNVTPDNLAYVVYTSGSTGNPKGVAVPHKAVTRLVCNPNYIKIEPPDKIAQVSNISFDAATFEIWGALLNGAQLIGINRDILLSPPEFALILHQEKISILFLTTALFQQLARAVPQAFASLQYLLFGGEAVDPKWVQKVLKNGSPKHLLHVYGPTENTTFSSYYRVQDIPESATSIPIGSPITNTQIYLLDTYLQPVPIGIPGELYLSGDGLARSYLNRPDLTAEKFIPNPFWDFKSESKSQQRLYKTGDLARYQADGNIEFLGRVDAQVKIRGFRIELGEIEAALSQNSAVAEAVVITYEDIPDDKHLVAYIVLNEQQIELKPSSVASTLRQFLKEKLPEYMVPSAYIVLDSLPLTPNGKVNRRALPVPDTFSFETSESYLAPRTSVEEKIVEIWGKVLGKKQIGIHDNFFELGGHSLLATQLTSRIRDAFQIELSVRNLFEAPTVASLARYIETMRWVATGLDTRSNLHNQREEVEF